jgi:NDP-sugar pyrophosphorylase family protein
MVLAAGLGSRLRPLTSCLPKPLVPICNRPLLWYLIRQIKHAGIREIAINLHYRGAQIRRWLGRGQHLGVEITYSEEADLLGSAGGVGRLRHFFGDQTALIVHGDILFDVDLSIVIQYHLSRAAQATLVLHPAHHRYNYGKIKVNAQGQIGQFVEHQAPGVDGPLIDTVFTGVQVLDPAVLDTIPTESADSLTATVYPGLLTTAARFYGYLMQGYWSDIGTPRRYWETSMDVVAGRVGSAVHLLQSACDLGKGCRPEMRQTNSVRPPVAVAPGSIWTLDSTLGPEVIVGEGCQLARDVHLVQSVLWPRVQVGQGARIERSIVLSDVTIPAGAQLVDKIVSSEGIVDF